MKEQKLINFLVEVGKLTNINRKIYAIDSTNYESVAAHTYHMIFTSVILLEDKLPTEKLLKIIKLILVHDLGEIAVGDLPFNNKPPSHSDLEKQAYQNIVKLLPEEKQLEYLELFDDFENNNSEEAKYAKAIDKLQSQIVCYSHSINNVPYTNLGMATIDQCQKLIWKYIIPIFPEYQFVIDKVKEALETT